jgi:hypothetical protein
MGQEPNSLREHIRIIACLALKMKICVYINEAKEDPNGNL